MADRLRQRLPRRGVRTARHLGPRAPAGDEDARAGGVGERPGHGPAAAGLLRVPRVPHGAVETYHKILDDAIQELKETDFKELFAVELAEKAKLIVQDCVIETDLEILIPESYVNNTSERLQLYSRLDNIRDEEHLQKFSDELIDRFGDTPTSVIELINTVRLRWLSERAGFEKLILKGGKLRGYFVSTNDAYFNSDIFGKVLQFIQAHPRKCKLREKSGKPMLVVDAAETVDDVIELFREMIGQEIKPLDEVLSK